ncbi:amino acid adenylation domain-containing protein [Streptomyces noursei]|uniref:non-ribosomal peptide synthetase family protein n=1 Tax=Streptomyces noursei TaxID=1971 RepID=UPI0030EFB7A7
MSEPSLLPTPSGWEAFAASPEQRRAAALDGERGRHMHRAVYTVTGPTEDGALRAAVAEVVRRHEILHTRVAPAAQGEDPVQFLAADASPQIDWELTPGGERTWRLRLDLPAALADRATAHLLVSELAHAYDGMGTAADPQYADVAAWLDDVLATPAAAQARQVLLRQVTPELLTPRLPFEKRQAPTGIHSCVVTCETGPKLAALLDRFGPGTAEEETLLLTCWQVLLGRLAAPGADRGPAVAVAVDGRRRPDLGGTLGPLTRHLPLAGAPLTGSPLGELTLNVGKERAALTEDVHHFLWPHRPEPGWPEACLPYGPYAFAYECWAEPVESCDGVRFALEELLGPIERRAVELGCIRRGERLLLELRHEPEALPEGYGGQLLDQYCALLTEACERPSAAPAELSLLTPDTRRALLAAGEAAPGAAALDGGALQAVLDRARELPSETAVFDGERQMSYRELAEATEAFAAQLATRGVGGKTVAVSLDRGTEAVIAALAVLRAGGVYAPLDRANPAVRIEQMLRGLAPHTVIDSPDQVRAAATAAPGAPGTPTGDELAYVIHTSGSTGAPKPVAVPHRSLLTRLEWSRAVVPLGLGDRVLMAAGLGFDFSLWEMLAPLTSGASIVLADDATYQYPDALVRLLRERRVTVAHFTPALLDLVVATPGFAELTELRLVLSGGAALDAATARRFHDASRAQLVNQYGPTEAAIDVTYWRHTEDASTGAAPEAVPIGRPAPGCTVRVLDGRLQPAPVGVPGEIHLAGDTLAHGYVGLPAQTAARFVADPYGTGTRMYRTGDLGRLRPDGAIEFLGRADEEISLRGYRIHPAEVETALRAHPAVASCAVALDTGGGVERLVAFHVPAGEARPAAAELREWLVERLPVGMRPESHVRVEALPLTASGKTDRAALATLTGNERTRSEYRAPGSEVEKVLARLWLQHLNSKGRSEQLEQVGLDDDFYELGGHSLVALGLLSAIRDALQVQVPLARLLRATTVAQLAEVVTECEPRSGHAAKVARIWLRVSSMSDHEAAAALAGRTGQEEKAQ